MTVPEIATLDLTDGEKKAYANRYPEHPLTYRGDKWLDKSSGIVVPKDLAGNTLFRKQITDRAFEDSGYQSALMAACAVSPLLWLNTFAMTYRPKYTGPDGIERSAGVRYRYKQYWYNMPVADAPVITWPAQDDMVLEMQHTFAQGGTLLVDKSREQGATVICMYMIMWGWLFVPRFSALVISRKADMVDGPTEDSLLGKIDYCMKYLPAWMVSTAQVTRRHGNNPVIRNDSMNTRIIGETSNKDVGQSLRTTVTFVDEAARFPNGKALMKSITSVSSAYILASTPDGPGTEFSKMCEHATTRDGASRLRVKTLGYWDHPEMGANRELVRDKDGKITGKTGSYYWETPAFAAKREVSVSNRDIRENWLIDHDTSGLLVLDPNALSKMRRSIVEPLKRYKIVFPNGNHEDWSLQEDPDGELKVWIDIEEILLKEGEDAPCATREDNYIQGWDFSQGVEGSNTIGAVSSRATGQIVAEWASPSIPPHDCAPIAVVMGQIFGGALGHSFIIWERNGPGLAFGYEMVNKFKYPHLYYQRTEDARSKKKSRRWGWQSTTNSREILFDQLNIAMKSGEFTVLGEEGVGDMAQWIYDDYGRIVCGSLRDESTGAQARHGDRAISYALCVKARNEVRLFVSAERKYSTTTLGHIAGHTQKMAIAAAPDNIKGFRDPFGRF